MLLRHTEDYETSVTLDFEYLRLLRFANLNSIVS